MLDDITLFDNAPAEDAAAPPLCLVHYFGATGQGPPPSPYKGRVAEREGNLIVLEFAPPPRTVLGKPRRPLLRKAGDTLFLLLLLVSIIGCVAAFRF